MSYAKAKIAGLVIALVVCMAAASGQAAVLYNNGAATGTSGACDQTAASGTGCIGGTGWTIYDDFTLSSNSNVTGFTYNSYVPVCDCGDLSTDYIGTIWSIWNVDPQSNYPTGPIFSGTTPGTLSSGDASSILVTVGGLSIDLGPGTYWLGTSNDEQYSYDATDYAYTSNGFSDAEQSNQIGTFYNVGLTDAAFTIEGTAVPEPASLSIFGVGLAGLGWMRRRRKGARSSPLSLGRAIHITFAAAVIACLAPVAGARAAAIDYVLSGVTANFGTGTVTLSGTFTYDPVSNMESFADISLTGGSFALDGVYNNESFFPVGPNLNFIEAFDTSGDELTLISPVQIFDINTPIATVEVQSGGTGYPTYLGGAEYLDDNATGSVDPVPEPATLGVFGAGLAGLCWLRRRKAA